MSEKKKHTNTKPHWLLNRFVVWANVFFLKTFITLFLFLFFFSFASSMALCFIPNDTGTMHNTKPNWIIVNLLYAQLQIWTGKSKPKMHEPIALHITIKKKKKKLNYICQELNLIGAFLSFNRIHRHTYTQINEYVQ